MADSARPVVDTTALSRIQERVTVIRDERVEFVPNVGVVLGDDSVLVVDTAMGRENGERILEAATELAGGRRLFLTTTHFHPEHAFGAMAFRDGAVYVANAAQADELRAKGPEYVTMFSGFGEALAELLEGVELAYPHVVYEGNRAVLDLGGLAVELLYYGPAHTRGDQLVWIPELRVLFPGDLVENRFLPIFPDGDADGSRWLALLDRIDELSPETIVPGHGDVGGPELVAELREYLLLVRERVQELQASGSSPEEIEGALKGDLESRYHGWDNQMWIPSAIQSFARE
jgi:glyoxylase-like metal-dependent hydrolase (beta-lactamase superfamily II)